MAMNNCPRCGKQIPDAVQACPGCGYVLEEYKVTVQGRHSSAATAVAALREVCGYTPDRAAQVLNAMPEVVYTTAALEEAVHMAQLLSDAGFDVALYGKEGQVCFQRDLKD
ncbi:zinc-ribbon domain-containing protein [Oscillibacter hominis]|uniref:Zinc-ribbon domain-containing protein n=1 Tax=Oscillibacter hominis TaxID=2763056 RepID=A0A7G9B5I0_9FIRM|nr:zinc ribbon domain-containing protein [Oscillibacter hominis]QNL44811.1 zinc-ribbon domain-containing protein [Oscillibacter hominis]